MPCEIVGLHFFANSSEIHPVEGVLDTKFICDYAVAHEEAGFDRILIGQTATWPDGLCIASHVASVTHKLKFMIAHRPGFIAPTMAARMFATIDQLSGGRVGVHIITGASDIEMHCDGDFHTKEQRYRRSREYVDVLRQIWSSDAPSDFRGDWYRFNRGYSAIKPQQTNIPIYWGGGSDLAIELGAECADVYAIGPGTLAQTASIIERYKTKAARFGRDPGISMSMRVIVGETEEAAWDYAASIQQTVGKIQASGIKIGRDKGPDDLGAKHLMALAAQGDCLDQRLWTGLTKATEGRLHAMALVGTAEQVSDALMEYYKIGVDRFLLNGFDTVNDVRLFGKKLIPLIREKVALEDSKSLK